MSSVPASLIAEQTDRDASRAWRFAGTVLAVLVCVFMLYWPSADSLIQVWSDTGKITYTHGFVIAAIAAWMILRRRAEFGAQPWSPSIPAALLTAGAAFVWLIAVRSGIELIHQLVLLAVLWLSVWALFGRRIASLTWLPIGYLIFAVPVWDEIIFILQALTVKAVGFFLQVSSISAYVEGNYVHLAVGLFEVAGGCSGVHFLMVALALATLYGEIGRDSLKVRIQLIALALGLALLTNWLRVYIIVVAGYLTDMQHYLVRKEHYNFGWIVFAVMMTVFFLLARRFTPATGQPAIDRAPSPVTPPRALGIAIAASCIVVMPAWELIHKVEPAALSPVDVLLPATPSGWTRAHVDAIVGWNPVFIGAERLAHEEYRSPGGQIVQAFVASYASQHQDKELVSYGNSLVGAGAGEIVASALAPGDAREIEVQGARERSLIRYYYDIGGHRTRRGIVAQLSYGIRAIHQETESSVVALRTVCADDCEEARALLAKIGAAGSPR